MSCLTLTCGISSRHYHIVQNKKCFVLMNDWQVLRIPLKLNSHITIMNKSNTQTKSRKVSLTIDDILGIVKSAWHKVRESKLTLRVERV